MSWYGELLKKQNTYSGPTSFEIQWNDIWTDDFQLFEMQL